MLTPDQQATIDRHLRKENWLINEDLIAELTDHYTAGIEERLTRGLTFKTAIREIHQDFGGRKGLLQMEEDKLKNHSRTINIQLRKLIMSYARPPRLSLTILMLGFAYWSVIKNLNNEWITWMLGIFVLIAGIPLLVLFFRNGYFYVSGKKQSMQSVKDTFYRYILSINLLNILNFFTSRPIDTYPVAWQTLIIFAYLLTGTIVLDFVLVQPYRSKVFA